MSIVGLTTETSCIALRRGSDRGTCDLRVSNDHQSAVTALLYKFGEQRRTIAGAAAADIVRYVGQDDRTARRCHRSRHCGGGVIATEGEQVSDALNIARRLVENGTRDAFASTPVDNQNTDARSPYIAVRKPAGDAYTVKAGGAGSFETRAAESRASAGCR